MYSDEEESLIFGASRSVKKNFRLILNSAQILIFSSRMRALLAVTSQLERCHHPDFILEQVFSPSSVYIK